MSDLIVYIPNHGYSDTNKVYVSWLDANYFVSDKTADTFKLATESGGSTLVEFTSTITDGFVRKVVEAEVTTITGLEHLEGVSVSVTSGGSVVANEIVSNGQISLSNGVFTYAVGKKYNGTVIPMDIDIEGTGLTTTKRPNRVIIDLYETIGGKIGQNVNSLESIPNVSSLTTDYRKISIPGGYTRDTDIVVRQDQPLPMTILSLSYDLGASRD